MRTRLSTLLTITLLSFATLFLSARPVQAGAGCTCLGIGNEGGSAGVSMCENYVFQKPDHTLCVSAGGTSSCTCTENTTCGASGQKACTVVPNWLAQLAKNGAFPQYIKDYFAAPPRSIDIDKAFGDGNNACRNPSVDKPFQEGPYLWICAPSQVAADEDEGKIAATPQFNLCNQAGGDAATQTTCNACVANHGVWTAVGCIQTSRSNIVSAFLTLAISLSGGVILLRLLQASFMLSTSQGEPNKVKEAQEVFTSSFAGLLFVLFAIVLLNAIGVTILRIPGF